MDKNCVFCYGESDTANYLPTICHSHLFHLLFDRFGECSFRTTTTNVVCILLTNNVHKIQMHLFNLHMNFCLRFPFNWRSPFEYLIAVIMEYTMLSYSLKIPACTISLGFGSYLVGIAASKCLKQCIFSINRSTATTVDGVLIFEQFAEFIEFHSQIKRLSKTI